MGKKSTFDQVTDWLAFAKDCNYEPEDAAVRYNRKLRTLELYFKKRFRHPPKQMFNLWKAEEMERLRKEKGLLGKEIVAQTHYYQHESSLTRAMMKATGHGLARQRKAPGPQTTTHLDSGKKPLTHTLQNRRQVEPPFRFPHRHEPPGSKEISGEND